MPLASLFSLQFYGPCTAAMVVNDAIADAPLFESHKESRPALNVFDTGDAPLLRPYRGRAFDLRVLDAAGYQTFVPRMNKRFGLTVTIGELSQDDVTGAVLEAPIESDGNGGQVSLRQAIRMLLAVAQGDASGLESGSPVFKSTDNTKSRVVATYSSGVRTVTSRDNS